jgi:hypothetical protein
MVAAPLGGALRAYRSREPSLTDISRELDGHKSQDEPLPAKMRKKLGDAIEKAPPRESHPHLDGMLDAEAEEISEVLNEALETATFESLIPWSPKRPGDFLYFKYVRLNRDSSHVTAYWTSDLLEDFVGLMGDVDDVDATPDRDYLTKRMVNYLNKRLSQREPQFRAVLARKLPFRRVPRVYFLPDDASLGHGERIREANKEDMEEIYAAGMPRSHRQIVPRKGTNWYEQ